MQIFRKYNYNEALSYIYKTIQADINMEEDVFTVATYIRQAEILNYLARYKEAYKVIHKTFLQEIGDKKPDSELHARILARLAWSELYTETK